MLLPLPPRLRGQIDFAEYSVAAKDAATIAVVRDGAEGLETFLMRRQTTMAFAAGMYVFPGGGVDAADAAELPWVGPDAEYFARRFGCGVASARALVMAAARETFEETGILLAGRDDVSVVEDTTEFHAEREQLERRELSFADFLRNNGLVLRADLLGAWAHWITPKYEPRRYDTRFFVAVMPKGQRIDSVSGEADHSVWAPLARVLTAFEQGEAAMLAPTVVTCRELANETSETVLRSAALRQITAIEPRIVLVDGEYWLETEREEHL